LESFEISEGVVPDVVKDYDAFISRLSKHRKKLCGDESEEQGA
jgi:hypothetical protein